MARSPITGYTAIDPALVIIGASSNLAGLAWLIFGTDASSPDPADDLNRTLMLSLVLFWIGTSCIAIGLSRVAFTLPPEQQPSVWQSAAIAIGGVLGLLLAGRIPFSWIGLWPSTDPRSEPGHVLGAGLFLGSFATVFVVVGAALLVSGALRDAAPRE